MVSVCFYLEPLPPVYECMDFEIKLNHNFHFFIRKKIYRITNIPAIFSRKFSGTVGIKYFDSYLIVSRILGNEQDRVAGSDL